MQALHTSATGMQASTTSIDVIANNLANQNTTGYKRKRAEFQDLIYLTKQKVGTQTSDSGTISPTGRAIGLGVKTAAVYSIIEQGAMEQTSNQLDLAINGKGLFVVQQPDGTNAYTRAGSFQINADGTVVTTEGYTVSPGITVPSNAESITVNSSGEVLATLAGTITPSNLGQLELASFINEPGLESIGSNLMAESSASGTPTTGVPGAQGYGTIRQGWLEGSNVTAVSELTNLIKAQRAFEMNIKVMEAADESMQAINQVS